MAPKRKPPMQRKTGSGAAKAVASVDPTEGSDPQSAVQQLSELPPDPVDPRLTLEGVVLGGDGRVDMSGYEDLKQHFAGEPAPDKHPDPERPGVRVGDRVPKGLRIWDDVRAGNTDKDGAGWIATRSSKEDGKKQIWFNIRVCGSWRLAFLLARLQRDYWDERAAWLSSNAGLVTCAGGDNEAPLAEASREKEMSAVTCEEHPGGAEDAEGGRDRLASTPKPKRPRPAAEKDATPKRPRQTSQSREPTKQTEPPKMSAAAAEALASNSKLQDMVAGNSRLQQIIAAAAKRQRQ